jgi:hypothetical protein
LSVPPLRIVFCRILLRFLPFRKVQIQNLLPEPRLQSQCFQQQQGGEGVILKEGVRVVLGRDAKGIVRSGFHHGLSDKDGLTLRRTARSVVERSPRRKVQIQLPRPPKERAPRPEPAPDGGYHRADAVLSRLMIGLRFNVAVRQLSS